MSNKLFEYFERESTVKKRNEKIIMYFKLILLWLTLKVNKNEKRPSSSGLSMINSNTANSDDASIDYIDLISEEEESEIMPDKRKRQINKSFIINNQSSQNRFAMKFPFARLYMFEL